MALSTAGAALLAAATRPHELVAAEELGLLARAAIGVALAVVASIVIGVVVRRAGRRSPLVTDLSRRARRPLRVLLVVLVLRQVAVSSPGIDDWLDVLRFVLTAALLACGAWLVASLTTVAEEEVLRRYRVDVADNRHNRRVRTQVSFMRRLVVALVIVVAVAAMFLTIPEVRAVGTGILASAGLLSVVAGLAAQSALTNVFAGIQLAFTDALRVDDVVIVETQFGKVEEITMTYVVVRLWDDRRMVLPSTYFTTTPFENWTRTQSQLLGTVLIDVDWRTDFDAMRTEMRRVLDAEELWDGRVGVLQVTDAVGSVVQVRVLVSAADAPSIFDLRCHVREALVRWLVVRDPAGLPRQRVENSGEPAPGEAVAHPPEEYTWDLPAVRPADLPPRDDSVFTGSTDAVERSRDFSGPSDADRRARAAVDEASGSRQVGVDGHPPAGGSTRAPRAAQERPGEPDDTLALPPDEAATTALPTAGTPAVDPDATRVIPRVPPAP